MANSRQFSDISIFVSFISVRFVLLLLPLAINGVFSNMAASLHGESNYVAFKGKQLALKWHYISTEMYEYVDITISLPTSKSAISQKLWTAEYNKNNHSIRINKINSESSSSTDIITELRIENKTYFYVIIKSFPSNLQSFVVTCHVKPAEQFAAAIDKEATVRKAVLPTVKLSVDKKSEYVPKGGKLQITCSATGFPHPEIVLKKADTKILKKRLPSNDKLTYVIRNVQPSNAGRYVCEATNAAGQASQDTSIAVRYIEIHGKATLYKVSDIGEIVELNCPIIGYPPVIYSWYKSNRQLAAFKELTLRLDSHDQFGNYTCEGVNYFGTRKVVFSLNGRGNDAGRSSIRSSSRDSPSDQKYEAKHSGHNAVGRGTKSNVNFAAVLLCVLIAISHCRYEIWA